MIAAPERVRNFIRETVRLDNLIDARISDLEFIDNDGKLFFTPDRSTWASLFSPIQSGQYNDKRRISGFAEVFSEPDQARESFLEANPFTGRDVSGILGKILVNTIFSPTEAHKHKPQFFLTEQSKLDLEKSIAWFLDQRNSIASSTTSVNLISAALTKAKLEFSESNSLQTFEEFAVDFAKQNPQFRGILLNDMIGPNALSSIKIFNEINFFDWESVCDPSNNNNETDYLFGLTGVNFELFEQKVAEFKSILASHVPSEGQKHIPSMAEILAFNFVASRHSQTEHTRFIYLTDSPNALRVYDNFSWNFQDDSAPLKLFDKNDELPSASKLFVRNPLCFLHDIELNPLDGETESELELVVDSLVPRRLRNQHRRISVNFKRTQPIEAAAISDDVSLEFWNTKILNFYKAWNEKKKPWVTKFWQERANGWRPGFRIFEEEDLQSYWRHTNKEFVKDAWQMGIYLAIVSEANAARAAPLVYIDCDDDNQTNTLLSTMQEHLANRDMPNLSNQIWEFIHRVSDQSPDKRAYFDNLVLAVLFMYSNQFQTAETYAEAACEISLTAEDEEITGREAYYLRSLLLRITAKHKSDFERARKLMLIAKSKLAQDNFILKSHEEDLISEIRFDLEDWSRQIVQSLPEAKLETQFTIRLLNDYLVFVGTLVEHRLPEIGVAERSALFARICDKVKFNFLVILVNTKKFSSIGNTDRQAARSQIVELWNERFGRSIEELKISVDLVDITDGPVVERAYKIAFLCSVSNYLEPIKKSKVMNVVEEFFGKDRRHSNNATKPAETSYFDRSRYDNLRSFCLNCLQESSDAEK